MGEELCFVAINPYTIRKSRTGGIIGRLISRSSLELVAARMFAPSRELVDDYLAAIPSRRTAPDRQVRALIKNYIRQNYAPGRGGHRRRVMLLLFRGEQACRELSEIVGHITRTSLSGECIRDTYGDFIKDPAGRVKYFEPAVLVIPSGEDGRPSLRVWARHSKRDGGLLKNVIPWPRGEKPEETTVLIKPDIFSSRSIRAGNIIDIFSKADMYIIAAKVLRMSVAQAEEFYGPVRVSLADKLKEPVTARARAALEKEFGSPLPDGVAHGIGERLNRLAAEDQFAQIVKFMTGRDPSATPDAERDSPGLVRCLALVYQGVDAVRKIRAIIGATDPRKADVATVRKEFGRDIMVNAAHASDSPESARREMGILRFDDDDVGRMIDEYLASPAADTGRR